MQLRLADFIKVILDYKDFFTSTTVAEWTDEQKTWEKSWSSYIAKGGERPPVPPPHA